VAISLIGGGTEVSVKSSLGLMFVCFLFLTMPTLNKTYLPVFIYLPPTWRELLKNFIT
jgi:hypothetical protein